MKRKPNYNSIKRTEGGHIFNNQFIKAFGRLPAEAQEEKESKMKNPKGLKCFVCDMEVGVKIFDYNGYIEYFRKRKKMKNKKRKISALDEKYFNDNNIWEQTP